MYGGSTIDNCNKMEIVSENGRGEKSWAWFWVTKTQRKLSWFGPVVPLLLKCLSSVVLKDAMMNLYNDLC